MFGNSRDEQETPDEQRYVRPMERGDIPAVVAIIYAHDEDDGEEAQDSFEETIAGMYVAVDDGQIVGVTGAVRDDETIDICWLSWTYVDEGRTGEGIGRYLVNGLLNELKDAGMRKVFISTGDYYEDGVDIYGPAKAFYVKLGAELELKQDDYYGAGEARYVYGLDLVEPGRTYKSKHMGNLVFDGLHPAPETDDALSLTWVEFKSDCPIENPLEFLEKLIADARQEKARFILASIPEDLSAGAISGLKEKGFSPKGELKDYYGTGVHQLIWQLMIDG